jgi:toxin FitB
VRYLLDTNVVSEFAKPQVDAGVNAWLTNADEDRLFLSVVTLAELRRGVVRLSDGVRRRRLDNWLRHDLLARFEGRILPIDAAIADGWGEIVAEREGRGLVISAMDALIAATALAHGLTLVTRNVPGFAPPVAAIVNPWRVGSEDG